MQIAALFALLSIGVAGCSLFQKPPVVPNVVACDYDPVEEGALPPEFIVKKGQPGVYTDPLAQTKAVRLRKEGSTADGFLVPFSTVTGRVTISFSAYTPSLERNIVFIVGYKEEESPLPTDRGVYLSITQGGLLRYYSGGWADVGTIDTTVWNDYRIDVDVQANNLKST